MLIISSGRGFLVAFVSLAAGAGGLFAAAALGADTRAAGVGFLCLGVAAWALGRHEPERGRACSLFFIPLRVYAVVGLALGGLFLFVPGKAAGPEDKKLSEIEARLRSESATGSSGAAQEKAAAYLRAIQALEKASSLEGKVSVHLDLDSSDLKAVRKASLYVQSFNLRKYGDEAKKSLVELCLKLMKADFPEAALNVAARGPILWGVRGSLASGGSAPVILVGSESPRF